MLQTRFGKLQLWLALAIFAPAVAWSDCAWLVVRSQSLEIYNPVTGITFKGRNYEFLNVARGQTIEIVVEGHTEKIVLPPLMNDRLVAYLLNPPRGRFDCNCFVHWMNGLSTSCGEFDPRLWKFEPFDPETVQPGDTLNMGNPVGSGEYQPTHAAIYIGHGLYLSKLNELGPLIIAELFEMGDGFKAQEGYFMRNAQ